MPVTLRTVTEETKYHYEQQVNSTVRILGDRVGATLLLLHTQQSPTGQVVLKMGHLSRDEVAALRDLLEVALEDWEEKP
jgi:hypothetical protein